MVRRLRAAGAILIGKTNLDQFATGLVGTRSPHGAVANAFRPEYISGGSSSGSASVVARGLAAFSLGTDTAGSGRVPAGFNNIVGLKPTRGWLSAAGVVPACRTLDCVSVFALTVDDALRVADIAGGYDARDPYAARAGRHVPPARPRFAVPDKLEFHGDAEAEAAFDAALLEVRATGAELRTVDFSPYAELAALLYQGPWVAERFAAVEACGAAGRDRPGGARHRRRAGRQRAGRLPGRMARGRALLVPTAPSIYTIAQLREDPLALNSRLGRYTNSPIWPTCARWPCRRVCAATACPPASPCWAWPGRTMRWPNSAALAGAPGPAAGRHRQAARRAGVA